MRYRKGEILRDEKGEDKWVRRDGKTRDERKNIVWNGKMGGVWLIYHVSKYTLYVQKGKGKRERRILGLVVVRRMRRGDSWFK